MKTTTLLLSLFGLVACNQPADKKVTDGTTKTVPIDSLFIDTNKVTREVGQPSSESYNCNFDDFIADNKTPKLAKAIYLDKDWNLSNDREALALLDSLTAKNKTSRPFYFKVVTKTYKKADGYFSEGLGLAGKEYIEMHTKEFIANFDNKDCFTEGDLTTWAKIVMLEFSISGEGEDDYIKKLQSNCRNCSPVQKENLDKFGLALETEWKAFLKNTD